MTRFPLALLLCVFLPTGTAFADEALQDENLLQSLPQGYKIGYQTRQGQMSLSEMVPAGESVENWTSMVTTQIFHGAEIPVDAFQQHFADNMSKACPGAEATRIRSGEENGYAFSLWQHACPLNPATGKPEYLWSKTLGGRDAFYSVQFAFRHAPSEQEVVKAIRHLAGVRVCDSRIPDRPCLSIKAHQD